MTHYSLVLIEHHPLSRQCRDQRPRQSDLRRDDCHQTPSRRSAKARLLFAISAALLFTCSLGHLAHAETIKVRGGEHDGFARLVFDWQSAVSYEATIERQRLVMSFGQAADFDVGVLQHDLEDYIDPGSVRQESGRLSLGLKQSLTLRHFTLGPKVVIDLVSGGGSQNTAEPVSPVNPPSGAALPAVRLRVGQHPDFDRLVFEWPRNVSYRIVGTAPNPTISLFRSWQARYQAVSGAQPQTHRCARGGQAARGPDGRTADSRTRHAASLPGWRAGGRRRGRSGIDRQEA